ncbi:hypothetical protein BCR36DRAFT_371300 [Piromyces finnis]|uniref:TPR-like protein n=1 Tax=Piromyces finnis TaxID=1754191 RepID=A0A1Y1V6K6_9FUNG|nr:hypothetical protein BCR36DRAFT_371300 [Piromyces finnis]|eukprot:ORX48449.1 hypothetical protein BCR36DRAFT_371300 [Piromyces finnis]
MVEKICIKSINNAFQNWDNNPKDTAWLQKAEKYIKKLLEKKINQNQLYSILGSIYLKQEKFSKAKKEFEKFNIKIINQNIILVLNFVFCFINNLVVFKQQIIQNLKKSIP